MKSASKRDRIINKANSIGKKKMIITEDLGFYLYFGTPESPGVTQEARTKYFKER